MEIRIEVKRINDTYSKYSSNLNITKKTERNAGQRNLRLNRSNSPWEKLKASTKNTIVSLDGGRNSQTVKKILIKKLTTTIIIIGIYTFLKKLSNLFLVKFSLDKLFS